MKHMFYPTWNTSFSESQAGHPAAPCTEGIPRLTRPVDRQVKLVFHPLDKETQVSAKKNFYSDNVSGAAPEILAALVAANTGDTAPYGTDPTTEGLQTRFGALFETEVEVFPVGTGTAANGLCTAIISAPYGAVYVSDSAHVHDNECGGAEFWSGG